MSWQIYLPMPCRHPVNGFLGYIAEHVGDSEEIPHEIADEEEDQVLFLAEVDLCRRRLYYAWFPIDPDKIRDSLATLGLGWARQDAEDGPGEAIEPTMAMETLGNG